MVKSGKQFCLYSFFKCLALIQAPVWPTQIVHWAVPENIHTPPTEGIGISWGGGGEGVL